MSDKASIIIRYDVLDDDRQAKGIISNHYSGWADPAGLVLRSTWGLKYFLSNIKTLFYIVGPCEKNRIYQTFRRMFDVDFTHFSMSISTDGVEYAKKHIGGSQHKHEDMNDLLLWADVDYGQLYIDIKGPVNALTVKYAFATEFMPNAEICSIEEYIQRHKIKMDREVQEEIIAFWDEVPQIMSLDELHEIFETDLYDYAFFNEIEEKKIKEIEDNNPDSIKNLKLTVRSYNCLKRAGINSLTELKKLSKEELREIKNLNEKCVKEILTELERQKPVKM